MNNPCKATQQDSTGIMRCVCGNHWSASNLKPACEVQVDCQLWFTDGETHCDTCMTKWPTTSMTGDVRNCPMGNPIMDNWVADHLRVKQPINPFCTEAENEELAKKQQEKLNPTNEKYRNSADAAWRDSLPTCMAYEHESGEGMKCECGNEWIHQVEKPACQTHIKCSVHNNHFRGGFECDTCKNYRPYGSNVSVNCPNGGTMPAYVAPKIVEYPDGIMDSSKNKFVRKYDLDGADILMEMAKTYRAKSAIYGHNFEMIGKLVAVLFPNGVPPELVITDQWHLFELKLVKLSRFAISNLTHLDSIHDDSVYGAIIEMILRQQEKDGETKENAS
jgi:hypothetical protein